MIPAIKLQNVTMWMMKGEGKINMKKRLTILPMILIVLVAILFLTGCAYNKRSAKFEEDKHEPVNVMSKHPKYDEENQKSLIMEDYLDYIKSNKESDYDKTLTDISVYKFEEIILRNSDCGITMGRDSGLYTNRPNTRRDYARVVFTVFPTTAIRESEDNQYIYAVYDTDLGIRVFLFFSKEKNNYNTLDGLPIEMSKSLNYEAFSDIKIGDKASDVENIDSIINEYIKVFDKFADDRLEIYTKKGVGPTSVHLLKDGILKIEYKRIALGDYEITSIEYNEDFILTGLNGDTCYKIAECDYVSGER